MKFRDEVQRRSSERSAAPVRFARRWRLDIDPGAPQAAVAVEDRQVVSIDTIRESSQRVMDNVERVIVGKHDAVRLALIAVLCRGHILIEDVPGVGKTV